MHAINFTKARDAFLLLSGTAYVTGYIVWAIVAWLNKSGPLPVIEGQYFAAGLLIISLLSSSLLPVYLCVLGGRAVGELLGSRFAAKRYFIVVRLIALVLILLALALGIAAANLLITTDTTTFSSMMRWVLLVAFSLFLLAFRRGIVDTIPDFSVLGRLFHICLYVVAIGISFLLITVFIRDVYPRIPQALGGARPQCGQLDLRSANFSQETLTALGANSNQDVARTKELEIFFQSSATVIVGLRMQGDQQGERFEIDRGGVAAIRMC